MGPRVSSGRLGGVMLAADRQAGFGRLIRGDTRCHRRRPRCQPATAAVGGAITVARRSHSAPDGGGTLSGGRLIAAEHSEGAAQSPRRGHRSGRTGGHNRGVVPRRPQPRSMRTTPRPSPPAWHPALRTSVGPWAPDGDARTLVPAQAPGPSPNWQLRALSHPTFMTATRIGARTPQRRQSHGAPPS